MLPNPLLQWLREFGRLGIACGPVNRIDQVLADEQVQDRGAMVDVPHPRVGSIPVVNSPLRFSRTLCQGPRPCP